MHQHQIPAPHARARLRRGPDLRSARLTPAKKVEDDRVWSTYVRRPHNCFIEGVRADLSVVVCNANGCPKVSPKISDWEDQMSESVYRVIEVIGTSPDSWERAAKVAVERAAGTLRDLRVAEVVEQDVQIENGKIELYRVKLNLSFKYEGGKE